MAPFTSPKVVISGLKEKFDSLLVHGKSELTTSTILYLLFTSIADRLYLGSSTGNLHIYNLNEGTRKCGSILAMGYCSYHLLVDGGERTVELVEVKKNLVRRSIEQLGLIKDVNSLVVLSGSSFLKIHVWL